MRRFKIIFLTLLGGALAGLVSWFLLRKLSPDLMMEDAVPVLGAAFLLGAAIALWIAYQLMPAVPRWARDHPNSRGQRLPSATDDR